MDGENWKPAAFPEEHGMSESGYTLLESTTGSLFVDVLLTRDGSGGKNGFGSLFRSRDSGAKFERILAFTNRNDVG